MTIRSIYAAAVNDFQTGRLQPAVLGKITQIDQQRTC